MAEVDVTVRPFQNSDIDFFAVHMRLADKRETYAASKRRPRKVLEGATKVCQAYVGEFDGTPIAIFGTTGEYSINGHGSPWLLGTQQIVENPLPFLSISKHYVAFLQHKYYYLFNFVDDRNVEAQRWLRWLGFTIDEPKPHGPFGMPFRKFYWRRLNV